MGAVFRENDDGTYDLLIDGRSSAYDLSPDEFTDALRRARYEGDEPPQVEDLSGYRQRLR